MGFAGVVLCLVGLWPYLLGNYKVFTTRAKTRSAWGHLGLGLFGYFAVYLGLGLIMLAEWTSPALAAGWTVMGVINVIAIWIKGNTTLDA